MIEYIEANLDREIGLTALAETAGMRTHYFSELFKQSVLRSSDEELSVLESYLAIPESLFLKLR